MSDQLHPSVRGLKGSGFKAESFSYDGTSSTGIPEAQQMHLVFWDPSSWKGQPITREENHL